MNHQDNEWAEIEAWVDAVPRGTKVKVAGLRGTFQFKGVNADGSIAVYGGKNGAVRSFIIDRCQPIF